MACRSRPSSKLASIGLGALVAVVAAASPTLAAGSLWDAFTSALAYSRIDPAETLARQPAMIDAAADALVPQRPGVTDLYLVTMAGDGGSGVFRREVESVAALFAERFDTGGRSIALINSPVTADKTPLATTDNLRRALARVGRAIDRKEDVLFLFLTSHGSPDWFYIDAGPVPAPSLSSAALRDMLDESGILWRVLVISACYSGSFIDELRDPHTLVITASRHDRNSFGCGNERDWTYFGDAYFNNALRREWSFIRAFDIADVTIAEREEEEGLRASLPQIDVGRDIAAKLAILERTVRMTFEARRAAASSPPSVSRASIH